MECNYCHKMGHIEANYFKLKSKLKQKEKPGEKNIETAKTSAAANENEGNIFFVTDDRTRSKNE